MLLKKWDSGIDGVIIGGLTSAVITRYRQIRAEMAESGELTGRYPRRSLMDERTGLTARWGRHERNLPEMDWIEEFANAPGYHILFA